MVCEISPQSAEVAKESKAGFPVLPNGLWKDMDTGAAFSDTIRAAVPGRPDQILYLINSRREK